MSDAGTWQERYAASLMNTFGVPRLQLTKGSGSTVWDSDGNAYLDLLGGIAVNVLGHGHPAFVRAVSEQAASLGHVSNFFTSPQQIELAERLLALAGRDGRVFLSNSGTEANEAALKLTRRTGRTHLVACENGFHGRSMGALALTAKEAYRTPFEPLPGHVTFVPFGDAAALAAAVTDETAAVVIEPMQGEAGVNVPPSDYLVRAREITAATGTLLWLDEIQTGAGRTGAWFAHQHPALASGSVSPDVVTVAKGLGGGFPIGATIAFGSAAALLEPGNHGTTFGGNPLASAVALAVLDVIENDGLLARASELGKRLSDGLGADPRVSEVRGHGLLIGLDLVAENSADVMQAAQTAGFIVNNPTPSRIRIAPPLVLTDAEVDRFVAAWPGILDAAGVGA